MPAQAERDAALFAAGLARLAEALRTGAHVHTPACFGPLARQMHDDYWKQKGGRHANHD